MRGLESFGELHFKQRLNGAVPYGLPESGHHRKPISLHKGIPFQPPEWTNFVVVMGA